MDDAIESFTVGDLTVKIYPDGDPGSPREWDNLGHMVCFHSRYDLGDKKHEFSDPQELIDFLENTPPPVCLTLYLLDHSGLRMNCGGFSMCDPQGWDWGRVGYIYVTREEILKEYSRKRLSKKLIAKVREVLESEVKTYDEYLTGAVYGYVVEDPDGDNIDSCWGFYGFDYCKTTAKEVAEGALKSRVEEAQKIDRMLHL